MSNIFTGNGFKLFYNTDTGNQIPDAYQNKQIELLAAMPSVTFNNNTSTIEVYDSSFSTKLLGDKSVNDIEIVVNYIPDNPSHEFLDNAVESQEEFQLIIQYQTDENNMMDYSIINGHLSSKQISGDKDAVVQSTYMFSPSEVQIRSARARESLPLVEGSYGVGSNGDEDGIPQYQPDVPAGNSFIKIPASSSGNPTGADVMGIGLIDQGTFSSIAMTKSGALAIYAKNGSTAWTRIVTSPMADAKYLPLSGGTITGTLTLINPLTVESGGTGAATVEGARTNLGVDSSAEVDAKVKVLADNVYTKQEVDTTVSTLAPKSTVYTKQEVDTTVSTLAPKSTVYTKDEVDTKVSTINTAIGNVYTKSESDAKYVPKTTTVNGKALSGNITLSKSDVGLSNVTNDAQLKISSNLSDLNNVVTARENLGLTALGIGGNPTVLSTMDWLTQIFVVGGLYIVAPGGMSNTPTDLAFDDDTTSTMIRVVATDGTFLTCEVWPSTSTESKFRMYNMRFPAGTTSTRTFWVRRIWDSSSIIPLTSGGTGASNAADARTNLGLGISSTPYFRGIELSHTTPFIDFHFNNSSADYTTRLIESSSGTLSLIGNSEVTGNQSVRGNQSVSGSLNVGTTGTTSTLTLGNSSFMRDNGTKALIITSNSSTDGGPAGLYLRPIADSNSTVQLYGNSTGWTFNGALTTSSTLRINGLATFNGAFTGNRMAIDLTNTTTDLNTCFIPSTSAGHEQVWICTTQGGGNNITNKPTGVTGSFWLQCISTRLNGVSDSGYTQTLYSYETSRTYVRYGKSTSAIAGTWAVWREVMSASNNGDLYVGANVPNAISELTGNGLDNLNGMGLKQIVNGDNAIVLVTPLGIGTKASSAYRSVVYRGTYQTPQPTKADDELWLGMAGYSGSEFTVMHSAVRAYATDDWTQGSRGSGLQFQTTATGTATRRSVWQMGAAGAFAPSNDNAYDIGGSSLRVKTIFAATGTINTSDARLKTDVRPFTDNEIDAAYALSNEIGFFKWKDSVEMKEGDAREHCGMTVQRAMSIMEGFGLEPMNYGFICYDEWEERTDVEYYDSDDKPVYKTIPAGNRYSFRFDQLNLFISRGLAAKMESIEARLSALENNK
ncbi:tail fiber domain-containing protein [Raoultella planticola]|uniref:tail fiber domain-containing protein n=1 Tax=Raoultella planticola TaxID=575 RepID=UPI0010AED293|nr:tail fiber domain-containing protein [Raoultella planticola]TJZ59580.1 tail fiber domain-containing protein [Raoultella planticola]